MIVIIEVVINHKGGCEQRSIDHLMIIELAIKPIACSHQRILIINTRQGLSVRGAIGKPALGHMLGLNNQIRGHGEIAIERIANI